MAKYTIGIDFGTLSARALLCETDTGRELGEAVFEYPHGVMDEFLSDGTRLKPGWALQHPDDYTGALLYCVPEVVKSAGVDKRDIVGIGVDFTSSTLMALDACGEPLCRKYPSNPHAWVKLWKHHAAQAQADRMTLLAKERGESFLPMYGGRVSSEWMLPKILETADEAPELYAETARFIEAGDWIVMLLTGNERRSASMAGYKAFWNNGYPSNDFLKALNPLLDGLADTRLSPVYPVGSRAGGLTAKMSELLGLEPGTAVAVANIDAHVSLPAAGITEPGSMLMIMGTSNCHITLSADACAVPGICGVVEDGVVPGLFAYEAGQSCAGDHLMWFTENCLPEGYAKSAGARGMNAHQYLTMLCEGKKPGESGLVALDWWNGNRSVLTDAELSGMILGLTLATKPEDIYRTLIEGVAFGTRMITENFETHGVKVERICACGGTAFKNPFIMQVYADVLNREIRIARSPQTSALGSAIYAAVAAGVYRDIKTAARSMGGTLEKVYTPNPASAAIYDRLYREYRGLHDWFGRGGNDVMKRLGQMRKAAE